MTTMPVQPRADQPQTIGRGLRALTRDEIVAKAAADPMVQAIAEDAGGQAREVDALLGEDQ